ncbi:MAG: hypothetical protein JW881_15780 [Spirochaetales bacterium]|nr:hypothetical protein [Spirochaetales bacterium]
MRITDFFNIKRFWLLIKRDVYMQYRTYLIGLGAIFCILMIVNVASIASAKYWNFNLVFYPLTLFIGGFIFTSLGFNELYHEQGRVSYIVIPASVLEKFSSKLIITSIGYVIFSLVVYFLFSVLVFFVNTLIFGLAHRIFNPFHPVIWLCIRVYCITQSVFLFGAVFFRRSAFVKTILGLFGLATCYVLFAAAVFLTMYLVLSAGGHIYFSFELFTQTGPKGFGEPSVIRTIAVLLAYNANIFFWFGLAPLLWVTSYFRLKEIEV